VSYQGLDAVSAISFTVIFLAIMVLIGDTARILINRVTSKEFQMKLTFFKVLNIDIALATAVIPLITLILTFLGHKLNIYSAFTCLFIFVGIRFYLLKAEGKLQVKSFSSAKKLLRQIEPVNILIVFTILLALLIRLYPTLGLYVYPADDAKGHSLLAHLIIENNGYPPSWGQYAPPQYASSPVIYMLGFHSICAFFYFLTGFPIEGCVLLITNIYSGLLALAIFYLASEIFENNIAGLLSAIFIGLVSQHPMSFFYWGGNAELAGDFLFITFLAFFVRTLTIETYSYANVITGTLLLGGSLYMHYFSFFIACCFVFPYLVYRVFKAKKRLKMLTYTGVLLIGSIVIDLPFLINPLLATGIPERAQYLEAYAYWWWSNTQYLGPRYLSTNESLHFLWNVVSGWVGLVFIVIASIGIILPSRGISKMKGQILCLICWLGVLLAVHENGPSGFYFIKIPFWYILLPDRFFLAMVFPLSCIIGYGIYKVYNLWKSSLGYLAQKRLMARGSGLLRRYSKWLFIAVVVSLVTLQAYSSFQFMLGARQFSVVTQEDYAAFMWIKAHLPRDAKFGVTGSDAGQWIPAITGRSVFPIFVVGHAEYFSTQKFDDDFNTMFNWITTDPDNSEALLFLNRQQVNYIYIGQRGFFGRPRFDPKILLNSKHYELLYHINGQNVCIFKVV